MVVSHFFRGLVPPVGHGKDLRAAFSNVVLNDSSLILAITPITSIQNIHDWLTDSNINLKLRLPNLDPNKTQSKLNLFALTKRIHFASFPCLSVVLLLRFQYHQIPFILLYQIDFQGTRHFCQTWLDLVVLCNNWILCNQMKGLGSHYQSLGTQIDKTLT